MDGVEHEADATRHSLYEINILGVAGGRTKMELVQRGATAKRQRVDDRFA